MSTNLLRTAFQTTQIGRRKGLAHLQRRNVSAYGYEQAKALVYEQHGEPKDVLKLHSHSIPPAHSDLVTLRFLASPLNPADMNTIQGTYPSKAPFTTSLGTSNPVAVPGNEGVAEVLSAGSNAYTTDPSTSSQVKLAKGDWVLPLHPATGTWRTHTQARASSYLVLPPAAREGITPLQAATVSVNPCTAWAMLHSWLGPRQTQVAVEDRLQPGSWFAQNGANSGVGRAAIQLGRARGLHSINVIRARQDASGAPDEAATQSLRDELSALGADVVVTEEEAAERGFAARMRDETRGEAVKLGLNCVGGRSALNLAKLLAGAKGAHLATYGAMAKQPVSMGAGMLIFSEVRFVGFWVSRWAEVNPAIKAQAVREVLDLTREGRFKDARFEELPWTLGTEEAWLRDKVQGTLEGYRSGKGVFVFGET